MSNSLMTAAKLESGNIRTPKGRLVYPSLFKPRLQKGETDQSKAKYQATLLIPKGANIDAMKEEVAAVLRDNFSEQMRKTTKIKTPFLKTADQPRFAEFAEDFPVMIRCNATYKPDVVGPNNGAVGEDREADEVYGGRWARLSVRAFAYNRPDSKGVSFGLQNVQLLDHAESIAGGRARAETEFESVGDGLDDLDADIPF